MVEKCLSCNEPLEPSRGNRERLYCDDRCRKRGPASGTDEPLPTTPGTAREGLLAWLENRSGLPETLVTAAEALAAQIDARPGDSQLWGRYLSALSSLSDAAAELDRLHDRQFADFKADNMTRHAAEKYRAQRVRAALEAGDDAEARRWARLVPEGCARGDHAWKKWPAGRVICLDCDAEGEPVAVSPTTA